MVANRAYKFRIYPNDEQKILFAKTFGCVRMVYNHWLDRKIRQYEENKTNVTYTICAKEMSKCSSAVAFEWNSMPFEKSFTNGIRKSRFRKTAQR